jgi:tRNA-2-methylthio-N6-dimethylallyladenosine synthase
MNINIKDTGIEECMQRVRELNRNAERKFHIITLGCQQNEADSEKIRGMARQMGYTLTDVAEGADFVVVNTCAIRKHAELKALSIVGKFKPLKKKKPTLIVAMVGCMAAEGHIAALIKERYHHVSFTLEPSMIYKLPELLLRTLSENRRSFLYDSDEGNIVEGICAIRTSSHRAWVSVMYGCNNFCSYCIVPYVRGRERSRDSETVIEECRSLINDGYREITLLGQNVNSYKSDIDFATLLEKIANIGGEFILRFMTSHPKDVSDRLIEVIGRYPEKIAPHFHLPLQSGSDRILKLMNRTYDTARFLSIVEKLRSTVPNIAITTDVIVGFPTETEQDFEDTLSLLSSVKFDMVYSFIYSRREGTRADKMDGQIPEEIKSERMTRLLHMQDEISICKNESYVDTVQKVLVDSVADSGEENNCTARTMTNKLVHFTGTDSLVGRFTYVKINRAGPYMLFGEEIKNEEK